MPPHILVVGSLNMDLVVKVRAHPAPGDTVLGGDLRSFPGGKGANQAVAVARAGAQVALLGKVGDDGYGAALREAAHSAGVDTRLLSTVPGPSGLAFITVSEQGQNMIVVSPGANAKLAPEDVRAEHLAGVGLLVMQLELPLETVVHAAGLAKAQGVPVLLNAAPAQAVPDALLAGLDYLVVNEGEAALLAGLEDVGAAVEKLLGRGVRHVVVTLGGAGVRWAGAAGAGALSAHAVQVVDTTAAGDAFCGALAARLAEGAPLPEAAAFANAAGALATTKPGAQPSLPERPEIETLLAS